MNVVVISDTEIDVFWDLSFGSTNYNLTITEEISGVETVVRTKSKQL